MEGPTKRLVEAAFRERDYRLQRLQGVLAGWVRRQKEIEDMVIDSFQAQDLEKISSLLSEKKWLERRIAGLASFLRAHSTDG